MKPRSATKKDLDTQSIKDSRSHSLPSPKCYSGSCHSPISGTAVASGLIAPLLAFIRLLWQLPPLQSRLRRD